jgi:hypothetical protein
MDHFQAKTRDLLVRMIGEFAPHVRGRDGFFRRRFLVKRDGQVNKCNFSWCDVQFHGLLYQYAKNLKPKTAIDDLGGLFSDMLGELGDGRRVGPKSEWMDPSERLEWAFLADPSKKTGAEDFTKTVVKVFMDGYNGRKAEARKSPWDQFSGKMNNVFDFWTKYTVLRPKIRELTKDEDWQPSTDDLIIEWCEKAVNSGTWATSLTEFVPGALITNITGIHKPPGYGCHPAVKLGLTLAITRKWMSLAGILGPNDFRHADARLASLGPVIEGRITLSGSDPLAALRRFLRAVTRKANQEEDNAVISELSRLFGSVTTHPIPLELQNDPTGWLDEQRRLFSRS